MKCPLCGEEITQVFVNSMCFQTGELKQFYPGVWGVSDYGDDISVEETVSIQCPSCMEIIPNIREDLWALSDKELAQLASGKDYLDQDRPL